MPVSIFKTLALTLLPFLTSSALTIVIERWCNRVGWLDFPGERKLQKVPVPRMGGLAFITTAIAYGIALALPAAVTQLLAALIIFAGGFVDDINERNSILGKLTFQIPGALLFSLGCDLDILHLPLYFTVPLRLLIFGFVFFMINASNLMDNMNGLTAGLSVLTTTTVAGLSFYFLGDLPFAFTGLIICSSVLGFGVRNFPGGKIYMGDQGSQFLGFFTSSYTITFLLRAVTLEQGPSIPYAILMTALVYSLFIADVIVVVCIRLSAKRSPFVGDQNHISHQLMRKTESPTKAAFFLFLAQSLISVVTIALTIRIYP